MEIKVNHEINRVARLIRKIKGSKNWALDALNFYTTLPLTVQSERKLVPLPGPQHPMI